MKRRHSVPVSLWLAAAAIAGLGWFWWQAHRQPKPASQQQEMGSASNPALAMPGTATNQQTARPLPSAAVQSAPAVAPGATNMFRTRSTPAAEQNGQAEADAYPRLVQNVFELQIALGRQGLSCGSIDGLIGPQTRAALRVFQQKQHLPITGELDNATRASLVLPEPPTTTYEVTSNDLARLQPLSSTWLGKSQQSALEYETLLELVAERAQSHPALVKQLNPATDWTNAAPGITVQVPNVSSPPSAKHAAFLTIHLAEKTLEAWDESTNLLAHFPCSIARRVEKRPVGELRVATIVHNPNYTFDPENFPESAEAQQLKTKLVLPPGPNNPVGLAWIGLDRPGYGIHGTPNPEQVGRTESHGCFRLANWNAEYLARMVEISTPVYIEP